MKKTFICLLVSLVLAISMPSCEQSVTDEYPIMEQYYTESVNLPTVTLDSVKSFSNKVDGYVNQNPEARNHRRYSMILENIKAASLRFTITVNDEWDSDTIINF